MPILLEGFDLAEAECVLVLQALNRAGGDLLEAMVLLGLDSASAVQRRIDKHRLVRGGLGVWSVPVSA